MLKYNKISLLYLMLLLSFKGFCIEFNTDLLDASNRDNLNLKAFEVKGYFPKGEYVVDVVLNDVLLATKKISTYESGDLNHLCLNSSLIESLNVKPDVLNKLEYNELGCFVDKEHLFIIDEKPIQGKLNISVPNYMLLYSSEEWVNKKLWDYGKQAFTANYNFNSRIYGDSEIETTGFGDLGLNIGDTRLRSHYQYYNNDVNFSGTHAFLPLIDLNTTLSFGELYTSSDLLSSVTYYGLSYMSDSAMIAPTERDYSPQISGYAKTNATVTIRHQGVIIYQTTVPQGNFTISDSNIRIRGTLDVEVKEQDGETREFQVESSSLSGMMSPGDLEYSLDVGKSNFGYENEQYFASYSIGYGFGNSITMKNSSLVSNEYINSAFELYKDLYNFGSSSLAFSFSDYSKKGEHVHGISVGFDYSKSFEDLGANVTFAGYRYSQKQYTEFDEFLNIVNDDFKNIRNQKERVVVNMSKHLPLINSTLQVNLYNQSYWNADNQKRTSIMLNKTFDFFGARNSQIDVSYTKQKDEFTNDEIIAFNLTVPISSMNSRVSSALEFEEDKVTKSLRYSYYDDKQDMNINLRDNDNSRSTMMSYDRTFDYVKAGISLYDDNLSSSSVNIDMSGSLAAISEGIVFSPDSYGETKVIADVGSTNVNINDNVSNNNGLALISNVQPYFNKRYSVDVSKLPDNVEFKDTVKKLSVVDGGVGFIHFDTVKGTKLLTHVYKDGKPVPFGATVYNSKNVNLGMFSDNGLIFLIGMNLDETYEILDGNEEFICRFKMKENLINKNRIECE